MTVSHSTDFVPNPHTLTRFFPGGQYVLLTFSNGPHHAITPQILDILAKYKVKATFFVYGYKAIHQPDILKRMSRDGHDVAHQGFYAVSHPTSKLSYAKLSKDEVRRHLQQSNTLLKNITQQDVRFFRPPYGVMSDDIRDMIHQEERLYTVLWSLDSQDQLSMNKHGEMHPDFISDKIIKSVKPGDIILCHDTQPALVEALPKTIEALHQAGYEFLTLSSMLTFPDETPH